MTERGENCENVGPLMVLPVNCLNGDRLHCHQLVLIVGIHHTLDGNTNVFTFGFEISAEYRHLDTIQPIIDFFVQSPVNLSVLILITFQ